MKIAILGTRGVPNHHGGFEQFASYFSTFLVKKNIDVYVYCSSNHPFKGSDFKGVKRIVCADPENVIGTVGQFVYDLNCILDARKRHFDIILQLGYTSSSIWHFLMPKKSIIITNMDGLEWKRSKYNKITQKFLRYAEGLAVKNSDFLVSDSLGIQDYISSKYNKKSAFIAYGADLFENPEEHMLSAFNLISYQYDMLIARMEPENNVEMIIKGYLDSQSKRKLVIVGNYEATTFGKSLYNKYGANNMILFIGSIYDIHLLNNMRYFSNLYFHGHSVGGTNPSLLEAMASNGLIVAHNNIFNRSILGDDAYYFSEENQISQYISHNKKEESSVCKIANNNEKIRKIYHWDTISYQYLQLFQECLLSKK